MTGLFGDSHEVAVENNNKVPLREDQIVSPPLAANVNTSPVLSLVTIEPIPPISPVPHAFPFEDPALKRFSLSRLNREYTPLHSSKSSKKSESTPPKLTIHKSKREIIADGLSKLDLKR